MTATPVAQVELTPAEPVERKGPRWAPDGVVAVLVAGIVAVAALVPLIFNPWFYFYADTPEGAYGQWYALGEQLLQGVWPLLNVDAWRAGNWVAEGQWGLWNPVILGIGVLVYQSPSALLAVNIIKVLFLTLGSVGVFMLARNYGARLGWAALAGVAAPFAGFTLFMDATSWVTNLMVWAFFPWVFWAARRFALTRRGLVWLFVFGYLVVTIGYVQGTIMTVLMFVALLIEMAIRRNRAGAVRLLLSGLVVGLVAVAVYLPGILTAPVTSRSASVGNDGFMVYTFTALATGASPSALSDLLGWWGRFPTVPYTYIAWFLPLLALVDTRVLRRIAPGLSGAGVFFVLALAYSMAPSLVGPLQFPSRTVPWVALIGIVITCVLLSRSRMARVGKRWTIVVFLWLMGTYLAVAQTPDLWRTHLAFAAGTLAALLVSLRLLDRRRQSQHWSKATLFMAAVTLGVLVAQSAVFAGNLHSRVDFPDSVEEYRDSLAWGRGDGFVVGVAPIADEEALDESLVGNFWYLSGTRVHNLYSPVQFRLYSQDLCMSHDGTTCPDALNTLVANDPTTGEPLLDLLSLDTIQIVATAERSLDELVGMAPPPGWSVADVGDFSVTWTRKGPTEETGGVVWTSEGVELEELDQSDQEVSFRVHQVPADGGSAVLSRLDWPGYAVTGGQFADPLRGYLLTVDLGGSSPGDVVTVSFHPPGWSVVLLSLLLSAMLAVALLIAYRPSRPRRPAAAPPRSQVPQYK